MNPPDQVKSRSKQGHLQVSAQSQSLVGITQSTSLSVGKSIVHKECCARVEGNRQTFSLHQPLPSDPLLVSLHDTLVRFMPLITIVNLQNIGMQPNVPNFEGLPLVDVVGDLEIEGELNAAFRGKELVFSVGKVLLYTSTLLKPTFDLCRSVYPSCLLLARRPLVLDSNIYV